jgi:basic membrane lipoprotein Med (substrate-binding protein (PBP1-ABC) superfamily)
MDTKQIIDYAYQDNGVAFRDALYSSIHDKVTAHIEAKKQEIAQNLIAQNDVPSETPETQETASENT